MLLMRSLLTFSSGYRPVYRRVWVDSGKAVRGSAVILVVAMVGCVEDTDLTRYVCDEPATPYLVDARAKTANGLGSERSKALLANCPDAGFHRRYVFEFPKSALVSKRAIDARLDAQWCGEPGEVKTAPAELKAGTSFLSFGFAYPWPTATGKHHRTEFRINRQSGKGGFQNDFDWVCRPGREPAQ